MLEGASKWTFFSGHLNLPPRKRFHTLTCVTGIEYILSIFSRAWTLCAICLLPFQSILDRTCSPIGHGVTKDKIARSVQALSGHGLLPLLVLTKQKIANIIPLLASFFSDLLLASVLIWTNMVLWVSYPAVWQPLLCALRVAKCVLPQSQQKSHVISKFLHSGFLRISALLKPNS